MTKKRKEEWEATSLLSSLIWRKREIFDGKARGFLSWLFYQISLLRLSLCLTSQPHLSLHLTRRGKNIPSFSANLTIMTVIVCNISSFHSLPSFPVSSLISFISDLSLYWNQRVNLMTLFFRLLRLKVYRSSDWEDDHKRPQKEER